MNESQAEPASSPEIEASGTVIAGRYRIERLIARGGMAAVYLAHQTQLNRKVAVKILTPPSDPEELLDFQERFRLEAETLASLDHPNIVVLHDFGDLHHGRFFLAMEYIKGPRLADILKDGPLSVDRAFQLIYQVAEALRYAHKRGVIHRDLKPSNLLVTRRDDGLERVKVVDFGLVKLVESDQDITKAGLILGSPHCMAPEQIKGLPVDARTDIYALGVLLYRTLTGVYPFHGPNSAATMIAHLNAPLPRFAEAAPDREIPETVELIVRKCLARSPSDRYLDVPDLLADMLTCMELPPAFYSSQAQSNSTIRSAIRRSSMPRKARWILPVASASALVVATVLVVVSVAVTYVLTRPPVTQPVEPAHPIAAPL
ncbi:MAG: serine/threonine protein kinase, partial [Myxococcales bacterium]|nr:serine/threonine protein kinase [Myxococcales bacterium]